MKYIDEFRDGALARRIAAAIAAEADPARRYHLMEFCGGHTHAISRYGVADLLPPQLRMIHGPGCPVCVLPVGRIDLAIRLALDRGVMLATYGDCLRVPASDRQSLLEARARGGDVRMVYSPADALKLAAAHPQRELVFFAIGFETTTPPTALVIQQAAAQGLKNFSVLANHVLTPAALGHLLQSAEQGAKGEEDAKDSPGTQGANAQDARGRSGVPVLHGFVGPAHVSTVIGSRAYEPLAAAYRKPVVIAGFEPLDVMQAILMLVRQINDGRAEVENEYSRAVTREGNLKAQALMAQVFELRERFEWRGLGELPHSALQIRPAYAAFDAERRFGLQTQAVADNKACECGAILRGAKHPRDCKVFGTVCTPDNPIGACMVSSEGACAAYYSYGRLRDIPVLAA